MGTYQSTADVDAVTSTLAVPCADERLEKLPASLTVRVLQGKDRGRVFVVRGQRVTGGRVRDAEEASQGPHGIVLTDETVSVAHFELLRTPDGLLLRDLGSTNGTWVGGARLPANGDGVFVSPGDRDSEGTRFRAGSVLIQLVGEDVEPRSVSSRHGLGELRGQSRPMRELYSLISRVAPTPLSVLICGETGTGKGAVARTIHEFSGRKGRVVTLDCSLLAHGMAEGQIMGYLRGAFTGATEDRKGFFEDAEGGTLFLDEVGELPLDLQPKLLHVIDRREVLRLGETKARPIDVRLLCATNRNLEKEVAQGRFRADLFHRISGMKVEMPPLRYRRDDIGLLASHFLAQESETYGVYRSFSDDALQEMSTLEWRGNVRELRLFVQRMALLVEGELVTPADLRRFGRELGEGAREDGVVGETLRDVLVRVKRSYCDAVMVKFDGNIKQAADFSGYSVPGFRALLRSLEKGEVR